MKTKEKLVAALRRARAPEWMIDKAARGMYDDYESDLPAPIAQLVNDAERAGLTEVAVSARAGDFDGTREEAEAWARGSGRSIIKDASGGEM